MKKKYFFKGQSVLQRKFIAGGLAATFAFGTVGSGFAGAMEQELDLKSLGENFNKKIVGKIYDCSKDKNKRAELIEKGIYTKYLGFIDTSFGEFEAEKPEEAIFGYKEEDKGVVDFIESNWEEIDKSFPSFNEICEKVYFPGEGLSAEVQQILVSKLFKHYNEETKQKEKRKFPVLRRDLIFQYFKLHVDDLQAGLDSLKNREQVLGFIKEEIVGKSPGFKEAIKKLIKDYKDLMYEKRTQVKDIKELEIAEQVVENTPDGEKKGGFYDPRKEVENPHKESHKVRNIVIIVALAVVILGMVGLVVYYLLSRGGGDQQKQNSNGSGNTNEGVKPDKDKENDMNQTQNSDGTQSDSQKSSKTKWIVGGSVAGSLGVTGLGVAYGVNNSGAESINKTKTNDNGRSPFVFTDPVNAKAKPKMSTNDQNTVESNAAKADENIENDKIKAEKEEEKNKWKRLNSVKKQR